MIGTCLLSSCYLYMYLLCRLICPQCYWRSIHHCSELNNTDRWCQRQYTHVCAAIQYSCEWESSNRYRILSR